MPQAVKPAPGKSRTAVHKQKLPEQTAYRQEKRICWHCAGISTSAIRTLTDSSPSHLGLTALFPDGPHRQKYEHFTNPSPTYSFASNMPPRKQEAHRLRTPTAARHTTAAKTEGLLQDHATFPSPERPACQGIQPPACEPCVNPAKIEGSPERTDTQRV